MNDDYSDSSDYRYFNQNDDGGGTTTTSSTEELSPASLFLVILFAFVSVVVRYIVCGGRRYGPLGVFGPTFASPLVGQHHPHRRPTSNGARVTVRPPLPVFAPPVIPTSTVVPNETPVVAPVNPSVTNEPNETPETLDLVRSMTPAQRRDYVANFLHTLKYEDPNETTSGPGRFIVSQSQRHVTATETAGPTCAICLEEFEDGEDICASQNDHCPHQFHLVCAFEWLLTSQQCPCCRRDYLTIGQEPSHRQASAVTPSAPLESELEAAPMAPAGELQEIDV